MRKRTVQSPLRIAPKLHRNLQIFDVPTKYGHLLFDIMNLFSRRFLAVPRFVLTMGWAWNQLQISKIYGVLGADLKLYRIFIPSVSLRENRLLRADPGHPETRL
jgi:hypothetical protein